MKTIECFHKDIHVTAHLPIKEKYSRAPISLRIGRLEETYYTVWLTSYEAEDLAQALLEAVNEHRVLANAAKNPPTEESK